MAAPPDPLSFVFPLSSPSTLSFPSFLLLFPSSFPSHPVPLDQLIPGLIGLAIFGGEAAYFAWLWVLARRSRTWPSTKGTITQAAVQQTRPQRRGQARATVAYRYAVNRAIYTGHRVRFGGALNLNAADAQSTVAGLKTGATVKVYFDPRRPARSTLEQRASGLVLVWMGLGLVIALLILSSLLSGS